MSAVVRDVDLDVELNAMINAAAFRTLTINSYSCYLSLLFCLVLDFLVD